MATIFPGRFTAKFDESFVVFIIGMRVNRLLAVQQVDSVAKAMPPMIAELKKHPEMGLLHVEQMIYWRGVATVQYWRSFDHLHAYAHMREAESSACMGGVQSEGWRQWVSGHLARELSGRPRKLRVHLREHAALRFWGCGGACPGDRSAGKRAPAHWQSGMSQLAENLEKLEAAIADACRRQGEGATTSS